jgi:hypothetical protein
MSDDTKSAPEEVSEDIEVSAATDEDIESEKVAAVLAACAETVDPIFLRPPFVACFLRARAYNVEAAASLLREHQAWRERDCATWWPHAPPLESIRPQVESGKAYLRGRDRAGRPLLVIRVDKHLSTADRDSLRDFIGFLADAAAAQLHRDDLPGPRAAFFACIIDFTQIGLANLDLDAAKMIVSSLSVGFPEHCGALYMCNTGWLFQGLWAVISLLLDARMTKKLHFISSDQLHEHVEAEHVPTFLGGADAYEFDPSHALGTVGDGSDSHWVGVREGPLNPLLTPIPPSSKYYLN